MKALTAFLLISFLFGFVGCTSPNISEPNRTGLEQLLLSTSVDNALQTVKLPQVNGKKVFVEEKYMESYDQLYVLGAIRALLSENGASLVSRDDAEMIVEPRSGALGIDASTSLFGIPSIPIVIPGAGSVHLPELSLYKLSKADAVSKLALLAYNKDGSPAFSTESWEGKSHFHNYSVLLLIDVNFTDIPEREDY